MDIGLVLLRTAGWMAARNSTSWIVKRMMVSANGLGFDFYTTRDALSRTRSFDELLRSANKIDAVFVTGRKLVTHHHESLRNIARLILPHPDSDSVKFYADSTMDSRVVSDNIRTATKICMEVTGLRCVGVRC